MCLKKSLLNSYLLFLLFSISPLGLKAQSESIRINQLGYYPEATKIAMVAFPSAMSFEIVNLADSSIELSGSLSEIRFWKDAGDSVRFIDFSSLQKPGRYLIRIPGSGTSYPFVISHSVLREAAHASLKSFYFQRSTYELLPAYADIWARPAGHPDTQCLLHSSTGKSGTISSPGGWYDAGDYGKYVVNAGISVGSLLQFQELNKEYFADSSLVIPESGNGVNDLLDEVKFELDWLKTMQDNDGGVFFKLTTLNFSGFIMPDKDVAPRYVIGKTTASTLDFAAMMALAGRIYKTVDTNYASDCLIRAENAWTWAKANPALYFKNPSDVTTGEYGDGNVSDEFIWAAAELYISTGKSEYKSFLEERSGSLNYNTAPGWPQVQPLASLSLATQSNGLSASILTNIRNSIKTKADTWLNQINSSACRIPSYNFIWGSNSEIANIGIGLMYAYHLSGDLKYVKGAAECADYLLGKNATGFSFVSGYGSRTPMFFHHRPSHADGVAQPVPGFVAGGPNGGKQDNEKYPFDEPAKCYVDVMGSYASNEVCINWNSPMTVLFAWIDAALGDTQALHLPVPMAVNNPPSIAVSDPVYDSKKGMDVPLHVKGTATDPDGIERIELYLDSRFFGSKSTGSFDWILDSISSGKHTATVVAFDKKGLVQGKTIRFYTYTVFSIPGKVEAEDYYTMSGITVQTTTDTAGGMNVSGISNSDYLDYSLNVLKSGKYKIDYRISSSLGGGKLELRKGTGTVLSSLNVPSTGGSQKWISLSDTADLTAGKQIVKLYAVSGGWNINWMRLTEIMPVTVEESRGIVSPSIHVFPNPVNLSFCVQYQIPSVQHLQFQVVDATGKQWLRKDQGIVSALSGSIAWPEMDALLPGEYFLLMTGNNQKLAVSKLMKIQ